VVIPYKFEHVFNISLESANLFVENTRRSYDYNSVFRLDLV